MMWDRFAASDPGLLRLTAGLRTVAAIGLTLAVLAVLGTDVTLMVAGAMTAMTATFAIKDTLVRDQAVTLALGLPVALGAAALSALLTSQVVAGDLFFVALIFGAVYCRRFGERGTALGLIGFQIYFLCLFVGASTSALPALCVALLIGFGCSAVVRFAVVPETPRRVLTRLRDAFRTRVAQLVSLQIELLDAGPEQLEKVLDEMRRSTARLHEAALMIQGRLEEGTPDADKAALLQRRVADAEISTERLGMLLLNARSAERADTLTLHLPHAPVPLTGDWRPSEDDATIALRRDLKALHLLVDRPATSDGGTAVAHIRNRLLGYRDEEKLPPPPRGSRTPSVASVRRLGPSWVCGWRWTGPRTSPTTRRRPPGPARSSTRRTSPSPPRPRSPPTTTAQVCSAPPHGPPSRSRWARSWRSSAVSSCPPSAGTGPF